MVATPDLKYVEIKIAGHFHQVVFYIFPDVAPPGIGVPVVFFIVRQVRFT